ncbi:transcriptional regulator, LacI family [Glycomyces sambucus]|uniref:Transcriptional regulator, LacI family n=1 Tax=Glycomyces sambucus TaxID=380244 RepID=A0A1G9FUJ4_9ACTN|nr:LacI family DNA-binding transcriptional regulator [Glycomyces sambucus]SDK92069.1 transcriptional regulator, LacI family [Glycomyces sambucus]
MPVTLKDIAAEAGVSPATVSNVVNGVSARVSSGTRERILRIVERHGYVPSAPARSLAAKSSRLVGLLVPAADRDSLTINPHTAGVVGMLERELRRHDYHLMLRGIARPAEVTEALRSWRLDGAVLLGFHDAEIDRLKRRAVGEVVLVAMDTYAENPLALRVRSDDHEGARLAAAHLLGLGHRRIAFAGPESSATGVVRQRHEGFRRAFADAGAAWDEELRFTVDTTHAAGREAGTRIAAAGATAVVATADVLAIGIMEGLAAAGRSVPGDVSVVGYDDADIASYATPKLTTVAQDLRAKAAVTVRLLLDRLAGREAPAAAVTLPVELVRRGTTAAPRAFS